MLSRPVYSNMPAEVMQRTLELPDFHIFHRQHANFPWRSHADWFLGQMVRWNQIAPDTDIKATSNRVYRTDIYRAAAAEMGIACPQTDRLPPGGHGEPPSPPAAAQSAAIPARFRSGQQPLSTERHPGVARL